MVITQGLDLAVIHRAGLSYEFFKLFLELRSTMRGGFLVKSQQKLTTTTTCTADPPQWRTRHNKPRSLAILEGLGLEFIKVFVEHMIVILTMEVIVLPSIYRLAWSLTAFPEGGLHYSP